LLDLVDVKRTMSAEPSASIVEAVAGLQPNQPPGRAHGRAGLDLGRLDDNDTRTVAGSESFAREQIRAHQTAQAPRVLEQPAPQLAVGYTLSQGLER
jgi:hypothetical protein